MNVTFAPNATLKGLVRYGVAAGAVLLALALREALSPLWGPTELPFIFFYPAIVFAAWYGRQGPGLLAIALSALAVDWFLMDPVHALTILTPSQALAMVAFLIVSVCIVMVVEAMHRANAWALGELAERRRADQTLLDQARLLDITSSAVIETDRELRITSWNAGAERTYGYTAAEAVGQYMPDLINTLTLADSRRTALDLADQGDLVRAEVEHHTKDGTRIWIEGTVVAKRDASGNVVGYYSINRDITDRKAIEAELMATVVREQQLRQTAEDASRLKDEFLATLSHELRNPLNVILGYSEVLLRTDETKLSPQLRKVGEALRRNALAQSHLIGDLLDLSRLRGGKLAINRETVALKLVVDNAVETVRGEAAAKGVQIDVDTPVDAVFVEGDPLRLEQIVWNLLNNAVKFTDGGGRVSIVLRETSDHVELTVEDDGDGIDGAFLPHVFEMFRQADARANRTRSGMGIGLALVQELVELHKGSVTAHSDGIGRGARFVVTFPTGVERTLTPTETAVLNAGSLPRLDVLVVDDSEDTIAMLRHLLELGGAAVVTATSGAEALRIAETTRFDVVLSDISMPGMDGFEFLRRLRELPGQADVPVLALTGFVRQEDMARAESQGFTTFLTKPLDIVSLSEALRGAMVKA